MCVCVCVCVCVCIKKKINPFFFLLLAQYLGSHSTCIDQSRKNRTEQNMPLITFESTVYGPCLLFLAMNCVSSCVCIHALLYVCVVWGFVDLT